MPALKILVFAFFAALIAGAVMAQPTIDRAYQVGPSLRCGSDYQTGSIPVCQPAETVAPNPAAVPLPAASVPPTRPGIVNVAPTKSAGAPAPAALMIGGVSEQDVDEHIANWGKPSRQAVRATLNPTDENITSMRRKNQADLAMSAYIANRAAQIDASSSALKVETLSGTDAPLLNRMKVILFSPLKCGTCDRMLTALQTLAVQAPMLEASVAVTSSVSEKDIILELTRLGLTLPVRPSQPSELSRLGKSPPFIHIVDAKNQVEGTISASASVDEVKTAIISYRKLNDERLAKKEAKK